MRPSHLALVANDSAPAPAPATRRIVYPDGSSAPMLERGVYVNRCLISGAYSMYAVDSQGDSRGIWTAVPGMATADEFRAAKAELWRRLDEADPVPLSILRAMRGPADRL